MLKNWFLLFTIIFFSAPSEAREFSLNYEDYVHLSDAEKDKVVIGLMEFMVELESKYQHRVVTYGEQSPEAQKIREILVKVGNLISFSSAHASTVNAQRDWKKYANDFKNLLNDTREADCVFAGWPSKTYALPDGRRICSHPSKSTPKNVREAYPKSAPGSACAKGGLTKIQCNPTLFGFEDSKKKTLFCVDTNDSAKNSAYLCMKKSLEGPGANERKAMLRENLSANKDIFDALQKYVYELCVCKATPDGFDNSYHARIRPHRTCYGMMNMLGGIACEPEKAQLIQDASIFEQLTKSIASSADKKEVDGLYIKFLEQIPASAKAEYERMCPKDPGIVVKDVPSKDQDKDKNPPVVPDDGGVKTDPPIGGGDTPDFGRYSCTKAICTPAKSEDGPEAKAKCDFFIHDSKTDQSVNFDEDPEHDQPAVDAESIKVSGLIGGKEVELSCSLEKETVPEETDSKPTLTVKITNKALKIYDIEAVISPEKPVGWVLKWTVIAPEKLEVKEGWKDPAADKDKKDTPPKIKLAQDSDPEDAPDADKDKEKKDDTPPSVPDADPKGDPKGDQKGDSKGDPNKISQDRLTQDYKVCAQLHKGEEKIPAEPACEQVDKLYTPVQGGMQGPQQQPMRRGSNTTALGIK